MKEILRRIDNKIVVVNREGIIRFINSQALSFLGYDSQQLEGCLLSELLRLDEQSIKVFLEENAKSNQEVEIKSRQGQKVYIEIVEEQWYGEDCLFIILRTSRKEVTKEVLQSLLEQIPFSITIQNADDDCIYMNPCTVKRHWGDLPNDREFSYEEAYGYLLEKWNSPGWRERVLGEEQFKLLKESNNKVRMTKQRECIEYTINIKEERRAETYIIPIQGKEKEKQYIGMISRDITIGRNLEKEIINKNKEITRLRKFFGNSGCDVEYKDIFDQLKTVMINEFHADGIGLWIYDKEEQVFKYVISYGEESENEDIPMIMKIAPEEMQEVFSIFKINQIVPIEERRELKDYLISKHGKIKFIGTYEVKSDRGEQIVGLLNVFFKADNKPSTHVEYIIKGTCKQIALLIENATLLRNIQHEFLQRKKIEKELEAFLSTAVDLIAVIDTNTNRFIKVGDGWNRVVGWSKAELLSGMCWIDLLHPEDLEIIKERRKNKTEIKYMRGYRTRYLCKSGEYKYLEWNYKKMEEEDIAICTAKDITDKKEFKERQRALEEAISLENLRCEFFANISHELRTPLNIILSTIQLLDNAEQSGYIVNNGEFRLNKYIHGMKQNAYRLLKLINNLIDITRIDAGYYKINLDNYNIVTLVEDITNSVVQYMEDRGKELIFDTEVEEEWIACDPDLIERIILNLLSNSIKYGKDKGHVYVNIYLEEKYIVIQVKDDGIGIPEEKRVLIFERFMQVDNGLTKKREGSGIGLSLVKSLVEMHEGSISVESEVDRGSTFIIKLPRKTVASSREEHIATKSTNTSVERYIVEFSDIYDK